MQNQIQQHYLEWLKEIGKYVDTKSIITILKHLNTEIAKAETIQDLINLFAIYTVDGEEKSAGVTGNILNSLSLFKQLDTWKKELDLIVTNHQKALNMLKNIEITSENSQLISFLQKLVNEPDSLLHLRSAGLFSVLSKDRLPEIITLIISMPPSPQLHKEKEKQRTGSFSALIPVDDLHKQSITYLSNLCYRFNDTDTITADANSLLQAAIKVYDDVFKVAPMEEISLDDDIKKEETKEEAVENKCSIM